MYYLGKVLNICPCFFFFTVRKIANKQKRSGVRWGEVKGGWPLLAVMREGERITGSCVLYEADREESQSKEMTLKAHSQNEREVWLPLERDLRLTLSYYSPFSICKYSMSSHNSSFKFHLKLFRSLLLKQRGAGEENTFWFVVVTQMLIDVGGEVQPKTNTVTVGITHTSLFSEFKKQGGSTNTNFFF